MSRWERWSLHILTMGITGSGLAYFWMKHLLETDDPFSLVNHPWQPAMLQWHLLLAPLLVFLLGMILNSHIARKLRSNTRNGRRTGLMTLVVFPVMVLSGYLLQVLTDPVWTRAVLVLHLTSGSLFALLYAAHLGVKAREQSLQRRARQPAAESDSERSPSSDIPTMIPASSAAETHVSTQEY